MRPVSLESHKDSSKYLIIF